MASKPCSGRTLAFGSSHLGPPTAPSSTACALLQAEIVASGRAVPERSMAMPPISCSSKESEWPNFSAALPSTFCATRVISGPMPSPGKTTMLACMGRPHIKGLPAQLAGRRRGAFFGFLLGEDRLDGLGGVGLQASTGLHDALLPQLLEYGVGQAIGEGVAPFEVRLHHFHVHDVGKHAEPGQAKSPNGHLGGVLTERQVVEARLLIRGVQLEVREVH